MQCFSNITKNTLTVDTIGAPLGSPLLIGAPISQLGCLWLLTAHSCPPSLENWPSTPSIPHFHLQRELKTKAGPVVSRGRTASSAVYASDRVDQPKVCFTGDHILLFPFLCLVFFTPLKSFPEEHWLNKSHALESSLSLCVHGTWPETVGTTQFT